MGFLYQRFYVFLFLLWLVGVGLVVSTTLWGDMSAVFNSLGVNGTVTESVGETLGVGSGFFQKVMALLQRDKDSVRREVAQLGGVSGNVSQAADDDAGNSSSVPAWKRPGFTNQVLRRQAAQSGVAAEAKDSTPTAAARPPGGSSNASQTQVQSSPSSSGSGRTHAPGPTAQAGTEDHASSAHRAGVTGKASSQTGEAEKTSSAQPSSQQLPSGPGVLRVQRFNTAPEQFTIWLAANRPVSRCTYFWMDAPRRLVLDVQGKWRFAGSNVSRFDQGGIEKIVFGEHPDKLRLVLYSRTPAAPVGPNPKISITNDGVSCVVQTGVSSPSGAEKTLPGK